MATALNQQTPPCSSLQPLVICPGHKDIKSTYPSREKAKKVGFKWIEEQQKGNSLADCDIDVRKDIPKVFALIFYYRHQNIESCSNPHVIFPSEHTACSGHKQVIKTYDVYQQAKNAGFEWLDEKKKDKNYTDCDIDILEKGKKYTLIYLYKHQNLDPSSNPYLRFPCQFLACTGHPHVDSVYSTEKKAEKMASIWRKEKEKDKSSIDYKTATIDGPNKNHALIYSFTHQNIDYCPKPHPIFPEFLSCPGHSQFFKTYETRKKAEQIGSKWLHEKQKDSYYQNCRYKVKDRANKVHDLICYFEHQNSEGCSNSRTPFDHFVENDHPSLIDKASQFFDKNRKSILTALVIAGSAAAATREIAGLAAAAREANDFFIRNIANDLKPSPFIEAHPKHASIGFPFPSIEKPQAKLSPNEKDLSTANDPFLPLDYSLDDKGHPISQLSYPHFQGLVSSIEVLTPSSLQTLQHVSPTQKASDASHPLNDMKSDVGSKLSTHFYQPIKNNIAYALGHPLFQGTLQAIGGAAEMAIGAGLTMGTTGFGLPIGGALMYHGYDHLMAGLKTAFTRQPTQTTTSYLLQKMGLSHSNAVFADDLMGVLGPMGAMRWLRATPIKLLTNQITAPGRLGTYREVEKLIENPTIIQKTTIYEKNFKHIFRIAEGHLSDTALNRRLLVNTASNPKNYLGKDRFGNIWHAQIQKNGSQIWTVSRNGQIRNGGINQYPKNFNQITGLSKENL